jgi:hypothetical protein
MKSISESNYPFSARIDGPEKNLSRKYWKAKDKRKQNTDSMGRNLLPSSHVVIPGC